MYKYFRVSFWINKEHKIYTMVRAINITQTVIFTKIAIRNSFLEQEEKFKNLFEIVEIGSEN